MPRNDVEWLSEMINNLIANQEKRIEMGFAAKKKIKEHFTLSRMTRNYIDLYTSLLNK
jgi:glycosyltransferase involved in cell wall biosynthesis